MKNFEKLNFDKIENVLSKSEMKMIMAGSGDSGSNPKIQACEGIDYGKYCVYTINGTNYSGTCQSYFGSSKFCSTLM